MKLIMEKLPLEKDDILLIMRPDDLTEHQLVMLNKQLEDAVKKLPHKNKMLLLPMNMTLMALRPIEGKFKIINEKITVFTEENL